MVMDISVAQQEVLSAAKDVSRSLVEQRGLGQWMEDSHLRPAMMEALTRKGFRCEPNFRLPTAVRPHNFDIFWGRAGVQGAVELKLKAGNAPADNSRVLFWHDLKWLESGISAGSFNTGTALLFTNLGQLYEESGLGDWRHDYYRIGHRGAHRCEKHGPDHFFDRTYPAMAFLPELFPLTINGCYDFRDKWLHLNGAGTSVYLLAVPVIAQPSQQSAPLQSSTER